MSTCGDHINWGLTGSDDAATIKTKCRSCFAATSDDTGICPEYNTYINGSDTDTDTYIELTKKKAQNKKL